MVATEASRRSRRARLVLWPTQFQEVAQDGANGHADTGGSPHRTFLEQPIPFVQHGSSMLGCQDLLAQEATYELVDERCCGCVLYRLLFAIPYELV